GRRDGSRRRRKACRRRDGAHLEGRLAEVQAQVRPAAHGRKRRRHDHHRPGRVLARGSQIALQAHRARPRRHPRRGQSQDHRCVRRGPLEKKNTHAKLAKPAKKISKKFFLCVLGVLPWRSLREALRPSGRKNTRAKLAKKISSELIPLRAWRLPLALFARNSSLVFSSLLFSYNAPKAASTARSAAFALILTHS